MLSYAYFIFLFGLVPKYPRATWDLVAAILNNAGLDSTLSSDSTPITTSRILLRPQKRLLNDRILGDTIVID